MTQTLHQNPTSTHSYSGSLQSTPSSREQAHAALARKAAVAGIVLLKNTGILPLAHNTSIALFGSGAAYTVKGGIGSGDVNNRESVSIYAGLKNAGVSITNQAWLDDYSARYHAARLSWKEKILEDAKSVENPFDAYASNPFVLPHGRPIDITDVKGASVAVYVLSRISGEGKDRRLEKGDYYLSEQEHTDLQTLAQFNLPIVLLLNAGGPIELTDLLEECKHIGAVLQISQSGQQGGDAVADILLGKATPEGKLTATWARRYTDYPSALSYGHLNGDLQKEVYTEGIYVGYRYFDSFDIEPLFPFGYGLSYTTFSVEFSGLRTNAHGIEIDVVVRNTGAQFSGREVVQVYANCPQTDFAKEYHRLVGFAKTHILLPDETQTLTICIDAKQFASFSSEQNAWTLAPGTYCIQIGTSSADCTACAQLQVAQAICMEQTHPICPIQHPFSELVPSPARMKKTTLMSDLPLYEFTPHPEPKPAPASAPIADGSAEELIPLLYGNIPAGTSTLGSAGIRVPGSAGETSEALEQSHGIPSLIMADGPAGLRLRQNYQVDSTGAVLGTGVLGSLENGFLDSPKIDPTATTYYQYCTAFPVGTALAQTWDIELLQQFGHAIAQEMEEFHVDLWLAPGLNIQRNPLCGRNFEYYSEDPFLSGTIAAAVTRGVQESGRCGVTIKHFACNNQEDNRMGVDVHVSERALREIYLRGFEIAVKAATPAAIMTSYNLINGVHAANSYDLCTIVARTEWGFEGVIMSDWNTTVPTDGSIPWQCAKAGNDIIMPGNVQDDADIRRALSKGWLTEQDIRICAGRIIALTQRLSKF